MTRVYYACPINYDVLKSFNNTTSKIAKSALFFSFLQLAETTCVSLSHRVTCCNSDVKA